MEDKKVMFTCVIKQSIMDDFKEEAIKQGVSRAHLLRIWIARAKARNKK
jgi:hypothetical protein